MVLPSGSTSMQLAGPDVFSSASAVSWSPAALSRRWCSRTSTNSPVAGVPARGLETELLVEGARRLQVLDRQTDRERAECRGLFGHRTWDHRCSFWAIDNSAPETRP